MPDSVAPSAEHDPPRGVELTVRLVEDPDLGPVLGGAAVLGLAELSGSGTNPRTRR